MLIHPKKLFAGFKTFFSLVTEQACVLIYIKNIPTYQNLQLLSVPLLYHSMGQIIKSVFLSVYVCMYVCICMYVCMYLWARLRSHFSTDLHEIW